MSWLATALASLLAVTTPVTARIAGDRAAASPNRMSESAPYHAPGRAAPKSALRARVTEPRVTEPRVTEPRVTEPRVTEPRVTEPRVAEPRVAEPRATELEPAGRTIARPHLLVHARSGLVARKNPWAGAPAVGTVASVSKYYKVPLVLWVEEVSSNGDWGRVELPYVWPRTEGWIPLKGLQRETTWMTVEVDLSEHSVRVFKRDKPLYRVAGATGAPSSPTPPGEYFVTDRVPFSAGGSLGSFAFGISGIQPRLPAGWSGGNQLAIHGTNNPSSLGKSVSAGCVRVSEWALAKLKPLLRLGTPVLIQP